jgi:hypothetical protein
MKPPMPDDDLTAADVEMIRQGRELLETTVRNNAAREAWGFDPQPVPFALYEAAGEPVPVIAFPPDTLFS